LRGDTNFPDRDQVSPPRFTISATCSSDSNPTKQSAFEVLKARVLIPLPRPSGPRASTNLVVFGHQAYYQHLQNNTKHYTNKY